MEKLKNFGLFELALFATLCRSFIIGPTISDSIVIMTLVCAITYVKEYLNKNKIDDYATFVKDLDMIKTELSLIKLDKGFKKPVLNSPLGVLNGEETRRF